MVKRGSTDRFFLLGVVAVVALVAIYIMVKSLGGGLMGPLENLRGQATAQDTIEFNGKSYPVVRVQEGDIVPGVQVPVLSLSKDAILIGFITTGAPVPEIGLGSSRSVGGQVFTYLGKDGAEGMLVIAPAAEACLDRTGQTPLCRGKSACLDGTCEEMPICEQGTDQVMWGDRAFHCCDGKLSGKECQGISSDFCNIDNEDYTCDNHAVDPDGTITFDVHGPALMFSDLAFECFDGSQGIIEYTVAGQVAHFVATCDDVQSGGYDAGFTFTLPMNSAQVYNANGCQALVCVPEATSCSVPEIGCADDTTLRPVSYGQDGCADDWACLPSPEDPCPQPMIACADSMTLTGELAATVGGGS